MYIGYLLVFEQLSLKFSSLSYLKIGFEKGAAKCTKTGTVGRNVCYDFSAKIQKQLNLSWL